MILIVIITISLLSVQSEATSSFTVPWHEIQEFIVSIIEGVKSLYSWLDTLLSVLVDHKSMLAQQAHRLALAETSKNLTEYADAVYESLYSNPEEERKREERHFVGSQNVTLLEAIWESIQMEYFLSYYRKQEHRIKKRHIPAALNPRIADFDFEIAHKISVGNENEEEGDGDPVYELERFAPYIADCAYAFPIIDFFFPFDGTFNFFETQYSIYDLWFAGIDNL